MQWLAQNHEAATPRGTRPRNGPRAVLAYVPDYVTVGFAADYARDGALVVVETTSFPVRGWATTVQARDLTTGAPTPDDRTKDVHTSCDQLHFHGNNSWRRGFGADMATRILDDLARAGELDKDLLLGAMLAYGHSGDAIENLAALIDRVTGPRSRR